MKALSCFSLERYAFEKTASGRFCMVNYSCNNCFSKTDNNLLIVKK